MPNVTNVTINDGFFRELGYSAGVTSLVDHAANSIAAAARATAPVGDPATDPDSGSYRDGIIVSSRSSAYRHVALVIATDPKSLLIESKTGNLARAVKAGKLS